LQPFALNTRCLNFTGDLCGRTSTVGDWAITPTPDIAPRYFIRDEFMYLGMESVIQNHGFDTLEDAGAIGGNVNSSFGRG